MRLQKENLARTASVVTMQASFIDLRMGGGFVKPDKSWDRSLYAFCSDGFAVMISGGLPSQAGPSAMTRPCVTPGSPLTLCTMCPYLLPITAWQTFATLTQQQTRCAGLFGSSSATAYIESASGIREGGRTGVTGLTICCFFIISLFFNPIFGEQCLLLLRWHAGVRATCLTV